MSSSQRSKSVEGLKDKKSNSIDSVSNEKTQFSSALTSFKSKMESFAKKAVEFKEAALEKSSEWTVKAKEAALKFSKKDQEFTSDRCIYKMPLAQCVKISAIEESPKIPAIVYRCIEFLDEKGLEEVGIYRVSGSVVAINQLKKLFENGQDVDLIEMGADVNAVASLLRLYLRELPENLLTSLLEPRFSSLNDKLPNASNRNSIDEYRPRSFGSVDDSIIEKVTDLCLLLPPENYQVLCLLFRHLQRVSTMESVNKMGISNLQVIFGPSLNIPNVILGLFISHAQQIFTNIHTTSTTALPVLRKSSTVNGALIHFKKKNSENTKKSDIVNSPISEYAPSFSSTTTTSPYYNNANQSIQEPQEPPPKPIRTSSAASLVSK